MASIFAEDSANLDIASASPTDPSLNLFRLLFGLPSNPWLLASCWPRCGWSLTDLRRVACKWRNLSVWRRRSIMFFSLLQVDRLLRRSTQRVNWNTIVHASSSATSLGSLAPNLLKPWPFALTCTGFSMLLFHLIKFLQHFMCFGLNLSPKCAEGSMEMPPQSSIKFLAILAVSSCSCYWQETSPQTNLSTML